MVALRERQKMERHRRIVSSAASLFGEIGYEQASMEAIADRAEVSKGTIYNYYRNKGELLLAIVTMEAKDTHDIGQSIIEDERIAPRKAILDLIDIYVGEPMKLMGKATWRQAIAMSILQPESSFGQQYAEMDRKLGAQLVELILTLRSRGCFANVADLPALADVLFNNINMMFTLFMSDDMMSLEELKRNLARQTIAVLDSCNGGAAL